jgi:hypothetical protein
MPLYVQNAVAIAAEEYDGSVARFCDELEAKTHVVETAQELILARVFDAFSNAEREGIAILSICDIPLAQKSAECLLMNALNMGASAVPALFRRLRLSGCLETYSGNRLKIHDAIRLLGKTQLVSMDQTSVRLAYVALVQVLGVALQERRDLPTLSLYLRRLAALQDVKTLVQLATDELFHELGVLPEIFGFLESAAASDSTAAQDRFWALDGLVFGDLKQGSTKKTGLRLEAMAQLIADHGLGADERLALSMKRMNLLSVQGDAEAVAACIVEVSKLLPDKPGHLRVFRYNAAQAMFSLKRFNAVVEILAELIPEYFDVLGIDPQDLFGTNATEIRSMLDESDHVIDDVKHLADCLDLQAMAVNATGGESPFGRLHALKLYEVSQSVESLIRVGQDFVDEFVSRGDYIGARELIETNLLPQVIKLKMVSRIIPVRSQYAVVLAYCGEFDAAEAEMERLQAYETGLDAKGQWELRNQRQAIARLRVTGAPPQRVIPTMQSARNLQKIRVLKTGSPKFGRNAPCHCGSGKKYKKCHGRKS